MLVPGNHDVNRKLCQGARLMAEGSSRPFEEPYFAKFRNFQQFFNQFYAGTDVLFDEDHLFQVYRFPEEQVLIVGFNSCLRESELDQDHYGWIGVEQVRLAVQRCDELDPSRTWLRIGALHHNFIGASNMDNENLRDRDAILPDLCKGRFHLLLHGHRHIARPAMYRQGTGPALNIAAAGSAGLDQKTLPDMPNQYQIIDIQNRNAVTLVMRQYSAQIVWLDGRGPVDRGPERGGIGGRHFAAVARRNVPPRETVLGRSLPPLAGFPERRASLSAVQRVRLRLPRAVGIGAVVHLAPRGAGAHGAGQAVGRRSAGQLAAGGALRRKSPDPARSRRRPGPAEQRRLRRTATADAPLAARDEMEIGPACNSASVSTTAGWSSWAIRAAASPRS